MKQCTICGDSKPLDAFYKRETRCKSCANALALAKYRARKAATGDPRVGTAEHAAKCRAYYEANKERIRQTRAAVVLSDEEKAARQKSRREYYERTKADALKRAAEWAAANPDKAKAAKRKYAKSARGRANANEKDARRRAREVQAQAAWADPGVISFFYTTMTYFRKEGIDVHVDHLVPLAGRNVCGLHVHNNLRLMLAHLNRAKRNSHTP